MMAEMGAEVIKVEMAPTATPRAAGRIRVDGRSGYFVQHNRGKKDLCIDAKHPEGLAISKELMAKWTWWCRIMRPASSARMGLGYERQSDQSENRDVFDVGLRSDRSARAGTRVRLSSARRMPESLRWVARQTARRTFR